MRVEQFCTLYTALSMGDDRAMAAMYPPSFFDSMIGHPA